MTALKVTQAPHVKSPDSVARIMWTVALALAPALVAAYIHFGPRPVIITITSVIAAAVTEASIRALRRRPFSLGDGSAVVTGMLVAFNLPPAVPMWLPVVASAVAVAIGKEVFGGLGQNIFNPALVGRAFVMASWPTYMTTWHSPERFRAAGIDMFTGATTLAAGMHAAIQQGLDAVSGPTPLAVVKEQTDIALPSLMDLFLGNHGGCIGEISALAILIGAAILFARKIISWHIPAAFIATTTILCMLFMDARGDLLHNLLFFTFSGGLLLGAFFMATDYPTSPMTKRGHIVFGVGCGLFTFLIRKFGGYPEGVCYSILIMNAAAPLIDRFTPPARFGFKKTKEKAV